MKRPELYLYLFLTAAVWIAIILGPMWADTPSIAAKAIALPFLAWLAISVYYFARWVVRKRTLHPNSNKTTEKRTQIDFNGAFGEVFVFGTDCVFAIGTIGAPADCENDSPPRGSVYCPAVPGVANPIGILPGEMVCEENTFWS